MKQRKVKCYVFKSDVNFLLEQLRDEISNYLIYLNYPSCDSVTGYRDFTTFTHLFWKLSYRIFVKDSKKYIFKVWK